MKDVESVKMLETLQYVEPILPNLILIKVLTSIELTFNFVGHISPRCELHDGAKFVAFLIKKCLSVLNNIGMID